MAKQRARRLRAERAALPHEAAATQIQRVARGRLTRIELGVTERRGWRRREKEKQAQLLAARFKRNPLLKSKMTKRAIKVQSVFRGQNSSGHYP